MSHRKPAHWTRLQYAAYQLAHGYRRGGKTGCEALAPFVGKAAHSLCNEVNPDYQGAKLGLDDALALELAADRYPILHAHAAACRHVCTRLPEPEHPIGDAELLDKFTEWQAAIGTTCGEIHEALGEGGPAGCGIAKLELLTVWAAFHRHMTKGMELLECLKAMAEPE